MIPAIFGQQLFTDANSAAGVGCGDSCSPRMQSFSWNSDGTPNFGTPVATGAKVVVPSGV